MLGSCLSFVYPRLHHLKGDQTWQWTIPINPPFIIVFPINCPINTLYLRGKYGKIWETLYIICSHLFTHRSFYGDVLSEVLKHLRSCSFPTCPDPAQLPLGYVLHPLLNWMAGLGFRVAWGHSHVLKFNASKSSKSHIVMANDFGKCLDLKKYIATPEKMAKRCRNLKKSRCRKVRHVLRNGSYACDRDYIGTTVGPQGRHDFLWQVICDRFAKGSFTFPWRILTVLLYIW